MNRSVVPKVLGDLRILQNSNELIERDAVRWIGSEGLPESKRNLRLEIRKTHKTVYHPMVDRQCAVVAERRITSGGEGKHSRQCPPVRCLIGLLALNYFGIAVAGSLSDVSYLCNSRIVAKLCDTKVNEDWPLPSIMTLDGLRSRCRTSTE